MYLDNSYSNDLFYGFSGRGYKRLIVTTPSYIFSPTITLTATGYEQVGNSITVPSGTLVTYSVSAEYYHTKTSTITVTESGVLEVDLEELLATLTINATPSGAVVVLTSDGYEQEGNSISVRQGKGVSGLVSADGYTSYDFYTTVTENTIINVPLDGYKLTIVPTPSEASVRLSAVGYIQSGNSILVNSGTDVLYSVSADGYDTASGTVNVTADTNLPITLVETE